MCKKTLMSLSMLLLISCASNDAQQQKIATKETVKADKTTTNSQSKDKKNCKASLGSRLTRC